MASNTTIGRPWRDVDEDNEFDLFRLYGHEVRGRDIETSAWATGVLCRVDVDGTANLERDGFCVALVRADTVRAI